jgi:hypothetical protein
MVVEVAENAQLKSQNDQYVPPVRPLVDEKKLAWPADTAGRRRTVLKGGVSDSHAHTGSIAPQPAHL